MAVIDLRIDGDIDAAIERADLQPDRPIALFATYDPRLDIIILELTGGRRLLLPRMELQGLEKATQAQISQIEIHFGVDICWPQLDLDHHLHFLLAGQYGSARWMRKLEMSGMPDSQKNTMSAFAKAKAYHDLYPLTAPFGAVERQPLRAVQRVVEDRVTKAIALQFQSHSLLIAAHLDQSIEVTLEPLDFRASDVSRSEPWKAFMGRKYRLNWLAMDQYGRLDTVLLAFEGETTPEIALTSSNGQLSVRTMASF